MAEPREALHRADELSLGARWSQTEWRLQRGVKAVAARLRRCAGPTRVMVPELVGVRNGRASIAIVAQHGAAEPVKIRPLFRHEIDRIARFLVHRQAPST